MEPVPRLEGLGLLGQIPARNAAARPDEAAIVNPDGSVALTHQQLADRAADTALALRHAGLGPGDRVLIAFNNTPHFFIAFFGTLAAGGVAVPVDSKLSLRELTAVVQNARPFCVLVDGEEHEEERDEADRTRLRAAFAGLPLLAVRAFGAAPGWPVAEDATDEPPAEPDPGALALILYTSGTTGTPKGVMHSHATILARLELIRSWYRLEPDTRALCLLPTHFGHGLICNCLAHMHAGGAVVLCHPFDIDLVRRLWKVVAVCGATTFSSVPAVVRLLLLADRRRSGARPSSLRFVTCASAPLRPEEVELFTERFGVELLNCYGITETASWTAFSPREAGRDSASVGIAYGCDIRAFNDAGQELATGEPGELCVRGPAVMLGYHGDPKLTGEVLADGWFRTGDMGRVDQDGRVYLMARLREVINRAGMKIYPAPIDAALMEHPAVAEAYACAVEDAILGETVGACVVIRPEAQVSEAELIAHCRERLTAQHCPDRIRLMDAIPKTSRGKVNRANLAALFKS